ncbi:MAG: nucleotidyltransferase [Chloroflexota bacterium]|nr:MAG: nucleotidyltransferase [Chloroflexota bacterium]
MARTPIDRERIYQFCRRHAIRRSALFGSVLREVFRDDSDIDVLVQFEPGRTPGFAFFRLQDEGSEILGRAVDLNTPGFLSRRFCDDVVGGAEVLYDAA